MSEATECRHGSLRRQCEVCAAEAGCDTARQEAANLREILRDVHPEIVGLINGLEHSHTAPDGQVHDKGVDEEIAELRKLDERIDAALHSSDAPASEPGPWSRDQMARDRMHLITLAAGQHRELEGESGRPADEAWRAIPEHLQDAIEDEAASQREDAEDAADPAPADRPECSCNPGWPENCPVHGDGELEDVVESDRPETDAASEALEALEQLEDACASQEASEFNNVGDASRLANTVRQALSQSGQAVPDGKAQEHADKIGFTRETVMAIQSNGLEEASEFDFDAVCTLAAMAIRSVNDRHRVTQPADGDSPAVPDGYVVVPKKATVDMIEAAHKSGAPFGVGYIYKRMIAAAPDPTGGKS